MTTITGTNQSDTIVGTDGDDIINGRNGSDVIAGLAGNDTIIDGNGNDTISDGDGNDTITTGNGNSTIIVGNGNDTVTVGNGVNSITVGNGADTIVAGNGGNTITAGSGNDVIRTGNGNDHIDAGGGNDQVFAGGGNDVVILNMAANPGAHATADGGLGTDTLQLELTHAQFNSAAVQADLAAYNAFLAAHADPTTFNGPAFHFTAFDLTVSNFETVNVVLVNAPVVITSGPESSTVAEQDSTTGSAAPDTTPTTPAGTLNFTDTDTGDIHTVAVTLASTSSAVPAATQADLATALTTVLHDSIGTGSGSVDWNFAIPDQDLDFLSQGQTLTVDYNVKVSDASSSATQTVELVITGSNDPVTITSGPQSDAVAEQVNMTGSTTPDTTPTHTLDFTDVDLADTHSVNVAVDSATWSGGPFVPLQTLQDLQSALTTSLHDSNGSGAGSVDWSFSIADKDLDFLSVGETLTITYDVTVSDGLTNSTQQVTITATGAEDPLVVNNVIATLNDTPFTDAGLAGSFGNLVTAATTGSDTSNTLTISEVNGDTANVGHAIAGLFGTLFVDSAGNYSYVANSAVDALGDGDTAADHFTFTVMDSFGTTASASLDFNIVGTDDNPVITAAVPGPAITEDAGPAAIVNGDFETGDLTGWTTSGSHIVVLPTGLGGAFGQFSAFLEPTSTPETLSQDIATTPGQHYFISFDVIGDPESPNDPLTVSWDGVDLLSLASVPAGINHYSFEVAGDALTSTTSLQFTYSDDTDGMFLDAVAVNPATGPATEQTSGSISFSDAESADTHTASFVPAGSDYVGTFSLDPVTETSGSGSVGWHFTVNNADIQFLAAGQTLVQDYLVSVTDNHGGTTTQDISVVLNGTNDAPTAVGETVVTDAGAGGTVNIPTWALALNDTDPDATDHVSFDHIVSSTDGNATQVGADVQFADNATPGGSFDYQSTDGIVTSNTATATIVNNATSATTLNAAVSGDSILIATNGTEALNGGSGNDILIGNTGSHTMTGGAGNDTFAFLQTTDGPGIITDFNNTTEHDHIAISASGFGGGLTAGMDVSSTFETTADSTFSGAAEFHFDTANQTLYFSVDGTQANAHAVTSVQAGVVLNPHDILVV